MTSLSTTTVDAPILNETTLLEETIFQSSHQNPFLPSNLVSQSINLDHPIPPSMIPTSPTNNIFMDSTNTTIFQQQPPQMSIFNNKQLISDDVIASNLDFRGTGNGYQKLPTAQNDYGADEDLVVKLNRMHTQSPQLPRKTYTSLNTNSPHFLPPSSIAAHESPRLQSKFHHPQQQQQPEYHNHYQQYQPLHAYKPLPQSTFSPVVKKRYGVDGNMVSEDIEFRILHGNTSPIVLQRFYHQQKQFRDQNQEELRAMQTAALPSATISNTNPFNSHIPIARNTNSPSSMFYNNRYGSSSPARNQYESNYYNNASPQHHNNYTPRNNGNGSSIPYRQHLNNSPMHSSSQYQPQPQQQLPMRYDRPPIPCPNSPQLDRLRVNLEKPNFYERHQLPAEVHLKESITSSSTSNGVTANEKSKGMLSKRQ